MKLLNVILALSIGLSAATPAYALFGNKEKKEKSQPQSQPAVDHSRGGASEPQASEPRPAPAPAKPITTAIPEQTEILATKESNPADPTQLDSALLSVLRDIDKSLRESEDISKLQDAGQRAAMLAALATVNAALAKANIAPNRIVQNDAKPKLEKSVVAESWDSGDIEIANGGHASLSVLWAKKVNGLVNVSITGNCGCRPNSAGEKVGEWVVVLNGKSTVDTGFDIQSQANVNFWLGKLNGFNVDATTCGDNVSTTTVPRLKALTTEKRRKLAEGANPAKKSSDATTIAVVAPARVASLIPPPEITPERKPEPKAEPAPILEQVHIPSPGAHIILPKRAIAGEYVTVSVLDGDGKPEPNVELSFNEFKASTNAQGRVTFQVPEDSAPGPTLNVSFTARPEVMPVPVYILQPLMRPSSTDIPRIDRWNIDRRHGVITIEGHNFDGIAENNRVILDARQEATIRFSSPVELQAVLSDLPPGGHDVIVQRNGIRSEPVSLAIGK